MARSKAERYADELGIVKPTFSQFNALIDECIFSERDRYIIKRYLLDNVTASVIAEETRERFPYSPVEELAVRRIIKRGIKRISEYL